jgi:hypothetical protein
MAENLYPQWLNLLKWSLSQSDGTSPSEATPMTEQDRKWLAEVMRESVKDDASRLLEIYKSFLVAIENGFKDVQPTDLLSLIEELRDITEQIDMAQIFVKYGGINALVHFIQSESIPIIVRSNAASAIGTLAQNNLKVQEEFLSNNYINKLVQLCLNVQSFELSSKILLALSCIVRGYQSTENIFCQQYVSVLIPFALHSADTNMIRRILFLSLALISSNDNASNPTLKAALFANNLLPEIFSLLLTFDDPDITESVLQIILTFFEYTATSELIIIKYKSQLESVLEEWKQHKNEVYRDEPENDQYVHELAMIVEIERKLQQPLPPPPATPTVTATDAVSPPPPVLLIAPPQLNAASPSP